MEQGNRSAFDYIVVGTGPAGAVIAQGLTDNKRTSVLSLEAGDNNSRDYPIRNSLFAPPFILRDNFLPEYYWQGKGVPQKNADDRTFQWTGGRTLGGSTSVNNEQYVRPSQANIKQWEDLLGPLWSPMQETHQFKKLENYNGVTHHSKARSTRGRMDIRQTPANPTNMAEKLVLAMEQATGFQRILDYNDPNTPLGPFTRWQLYQRPDGVRVSSDTAFLSSDVMTPDGFGVDGRQLRVSFRSTALRVLSNNEKQAIGDDFLKDGKCTRAYDRRKGILSAGINSPKLLMHSGIGPADVLNKAHVPILYDSPNVGRNLTTHAVTSASFTTNPNDKALPSNDPYALYTAGAFLPDPTPGADPHRRGGQIIGMGDSTGKLTIQFYLTEPKSRGAVRIQNDDPLKMVLADEGFLNNPADLETLKNVYKIYIKNIAAELSTMDPNYQLTE